MSRQTKTLKMLSLRINNKRLPQLERVVAYALTQGRQLNPMGCDTFWYMLDRWDKVLGVLSKLEGQRQELNDITGALK